MSFLSAFDTTKFQYSGHHDIVPVPPPPTDITDKKRLKYIQKRYTEDFLKNAIMRNYSFIRSYQNTRYDEVKRLIQDAYKNISNAQAMLYTGYYVTYETTAAEENPTMMMDS
jgi:hypothetical protein